MTQVKAQAISTALIAAQLAFTIRKVADDNFVIRVRSNTMDIGIDIVNQFTIDQGITGKVQEVELS